MTIRDDGLMSSESYSMWDDPTRWGGKAAPPPEPKRAHKLDSAKHRALLRRLQAQYDQEWQRQAHNRYQQALDHDYYDGLQWTEEDAQALLERGQAPVVYNEVKSSIDWLLGTERRTRIDYKVLPRRKEDTPDAEVKSQLLKYLSDVNDQVSTRSKAFADSVKAGVGWIEVGVRGDTDDEPIYYRHQDWRQMIYDSNAVELDLSDARYLYRWRWVDVDIACAYFPDRASIIRKSARDGTALHIDEEDDLWYLGARVTEPGQDYAASAAGKYRPYDGAAFIMNARPRVKLIECWYRDPVREQRLRGGGVDGMTYTRDPMQQAAIERGEASVYDRISLQMHVAIYCDAGLLHVGRSPYAHDRFPFVPIWAYRRGRDNAPYGPIRLLRDAQDGMNKRMSKALWILSTNQIEMEEGAVDDIEELRDEAARPDAIIVRRRGKEMVIHRDNQLAEQHLMLMDRDQMMIRAISGVTSENLGRETNADSGKAILARQEQGSVVTTELFDNLRIAIQLAGEIELSLVEQYYDQPKVVRLVGERGNANFIEINQPDPMTGERLNDITTRKADFLVSQQDYRDSLRQAMFESLFEIVSRLAQMSPEIAFKLLDLVVEMADVPNKDELVSRIRQLNGMRDPERDPTPEEQAQMQQQAQEQQMQKELIMARAKAELSELEAKSEKLIAEAVDKRLEAMLSALQSAQQVALVPGLGPVADDLLRGAGYVDRTPSADVGQQQEQMSAEQAMQQMAQAQQAEQAQKLAALQAMQAQPQQSGTPPMPGTIPLDGVNA